MPAGTLLKSVPGDVSSGPGWHYDDGGWVEIDGEGAVFSGFSVAVNLDVTASGVTVENSRIVVAGDSFGVSLRHTSNVVVRNNTITAPDAGANRLMVGVKDVYGDAVGTQVLGNDISHTATGVQIYSGLIQDNFIHAVGYLPGDRTNGILSTGGQVPLSIDHNTVYVGRAQMVATGPFEDFGAEENRSITRNLIGGGAYSIYGGQNEGGPTSHDVRITGNRFVRIYYQNGGWWGPITAFDPRAPGNRYRDNLGDDTETRVRLVK